MYKVQLGHCALKPEPPARTNVRSYSQLALLQTVVMIMLTLLPSKHHAVTMVNSAKFMYKECVKQSRPKATTVCMQQGPLLRIKHAGVRTPRAGLNWTTAGGQQEQEQASPHAICCSINV